MKYFKNYRPLTATPYQRSETYVEIEPCAALKPCIRCFWGSKDIYWQEAGVEERSVVVPQSIIPGWYVNWDRNCGSRRR